jgi:hypothetical protein
MPKLVLLVFFLSGGVSPLRVYQHNLSVRVPSLAGGGHKSVKREVLHSLGWAKENESRSHIQVCANLEHLPVKCPCRQQDRLKMCACVKCDDG